MPTAPTLSATMADSDFNSLVIAVFPPVYAAVCVLSYTVSTTSDNSIMPDFNITAQEDMVMQVVRGGFDLCNKSYSFSVVAVTRNGISMRSDTIPQDPVDFLS